MSNHATKRGTIVRALMATIEDVATLNTSGLNLTTGRVYKVAGTQVVGPRGAALPADATDLASAITLINAIKARMVAHGLVA